MKVLLINSDNDFGIGPNANGRSFPPLGILSLGTALDHQFGDRLDLTLIDGQVTTNAEITSFVEHERPDFVGISLYNTSTRNTESLIRTAKSVGAITMIGNDHAIAHYELWLKHVEDLDYVCLNDIGEETIVAFFHYLFGDIEVQDVPLLAFRRNMAIEKTAVPSRILPGKTLDVVPIPNRTLLDANHWAKYRESFLATHHPSLKNRTVTGVTTLNRARGCAKSKRRCAYCGINDLRIRYSSADLFWRDVRAAITDVSANIIYEAFDSASSSPAVLRAWARNRPPDISDVKFKVYAQAAESSDTVIQEFESLGVFCVNMGLDSGDDAALKLLKGNWNSVEINRDAVLRYSRRGIEVYSSFVLFGFGDESTTRRSLDKTLKFIEWMARETYAISFDCALLYPEKGSIIGSALWNPDLLRMRSSCQAWRIINEERLRMISAKWRDQIFLDPVELCYDFAWVCGVNAETLLEYEKEISIIAKSYGLNYGRSQGGVEG